MNIQMRIREEQKKEFLDRVEELYRLIREYMSRLDPDPHFTQGSVQIEEENIGVYSAPTLSIIPSVGKALNLIPMGCDVVAAEGQVHMKSVFGQEILAYLRTNGIIEIAEPEKPTDDGSDRENAGGVWVWVDNNAPGGLPRLNEKTLNRLLERLSR